MAVIHHLTHRGHAAPRSGPTAGSRTDDMLQGIAGLAGFGVMLLLLVAGFAWLTVSESARPDVDLGGEATLTGAPGEEVAFTLKGTRSIGQRWASAEGLFLMLEGERVRIVAPHEHDWDDSITYSNSTDYGLEIDTDLQVPEDVAPGTTLRGAIAGSLTYPEATGDGEFDDQVASVDIPVTLEVVTEAESDRLRAEREGTAGKVLTWSMISAGVMAGVLVVSLGAWGVRRRTS